MLGAEENLIRKTDGSELTAFTASPSDGTDDNLGWTFNGFVFHEGTSGVSVAVNTPATWPNDNSLLGEQTINLKYNGGIEAEPGDCQAEVNVEVFFPPTQNINSKPAWFKYWLGSAVENSSPGLVYQDDIFREKNGVVVQLKGLCDPLFYYEYHHDTSGNLLSLDYNVECILYVASEVLDFYSGTEQDVMGFYMIREHERGHEIHIEKFAEDMQSVLRTMIKDASPPLNKNDDDYESRLQSIVTTAVQLNDADGNRIFDSDPNNAKGAETVAWENVGETEVDTTKDWRIGGAQWGTE